MARQVNRAFPWRAIPHEKSSRRSRSIAARLYSDDSSHKSACRPIFRGRSAGSDACAQSGACKHGHSLIEIVLEPDIWTRHQVRYDIIGLAR